MAEPVACDLVLTAPLKGWATALDTVPDAVFAERMLGDGIAIDPVGTMLHAPCAATVLTLHASGHAITLRTAHGAELLLHIGLDTVSLGGAGFVPQVREGQDVRQGDALIAFDLDALVGRVRSLTTPIVVTNGDRFTITHRTPARAVEVGDPLMTLVPVTAPADAGSVAGAVAGAGVRVRRRTIMVPLAQGIHARPAARIGAAIRSFSAEVALVRGERRGNARSAVALLSLGIRHGETITIEASGNDADAAIAAIAALIDSGMGERAAPPDAPPDPPSDPPSDATPAASALPPSSPTPDTDGILRGITAAPGLAIGPAFRWHVADIAVAEPGGDAQTERRLLDEAITAVRAHITARSSASDDVTAAIMAAHLAFLGDPELRGTAARHIAGGASAGQGWRLALRAQASVLIESGDPHLAERADDLLDLEGQVLRALAGVANAPVELPLGCILVAGDLLPSQLVGLDTARLAGLCTTRGGPTSHVAILAAGLGLPALVAIGPALDAVADGTPLILDADAGCLTLSPDADARADADARISRRARRKTDAIAAAQDESHMRDGTRIAAFANLGSVADAQLAVANGAEGCGLLRTEFLFLDRPAAPSAAEQAAAYQAIADALDGRPVIVRLLDIGGDKPAPYLPMAAEENPALGLRGIRVGLAHPHLLEAQLRGILAVRPIGQCRIMVPMVASLGEVRAVRDMLARLRAELGIDQPVELGIMVETPAAAATAGLLAAEADFLSIGTNDLTQYTLAMDRGNPAVASGIDGLHPAVLRLIADTCRGAARRGRWTGVCGGLASDPLAVPILLGLGVAELSATPALVPEVKALIRRLTLEQCRDHARDVLTASSASEIRARATKFAGTLAP